MRTQRLRARRLRARRYRAPARRRVRHRRPGPTRQPAHPQARARYPPRARPPEGTATEKRSRSHRYGGMPTGLVALRPRSTGPCVPGPKRPRFTGVRLPPTLTAGADVTADAACRGAPLIVDRYLANKEVTIHGNPEAGPGARIAAFAGLRAVLGSDRLTACPARFHRMAVAELGRVSVASMVSQRAGWALAQLARPALPVPTCPRPGVRAAAFRVTPLAS
jgi:hypothetical protein